MMTRHSAMLVTSLSLAVLTSACATYAPAPLDVHQLASAKPVDGPLPADREGLLRLALERNPALNSAKASLLAARAGAKAARNQTPLTLTLTAEYSKQSDANRPWLYGGAVGVPLDVGGRRATRVTAADLAVLKARYAVGEAAWAVRQTLMQALTDMATSSQQIRANQDLLDQRNTYVRLIEKRVAAGEDAGNLSVQARIDASALVANLTQAQAKQAQAKTSLARVLEIPLAQVDTLAIPAPAPVSGVGESAIAARSDRALIIRQDVLNAVADYDSAENDLRAAVAGQFPDISVEPGYTWERGVVKLPFAGVLTLPPLDGNRANIRQAQAAREAAGKTLEDKVKTVRADISQAALRLDADRQLAERTRTTDLPLSENLAKRTAHMLNAGEADRAEALSADMSLQQTRLAVLTAEETVLNDRLKLEDALHQPLDPAEIAVLEAAVNVPEDRP